MLSRSGTCSAGGWAPLGADGPADGPNCTYIGRRDWHGALLVGSCARNVRPALEQHQRAWVTSLLRVALSTQPPSECAELERHTIGLVSRVLLYDMAHSSRSRLPKLMEGAEADDKAAAAVRLGVVDTLLLHFERRPALPPLEAAGMRQPPPLLANLLSLFELVESWGASVCFFYIVFSLVAFRWNYVHFVQQIKGLDLRDLTRDQFDQFGRLVDKSFQIPRECQDLHTVANVG